MKKIFLTLLLLIASFSLMRAADINYKFTNSTVTYSGTGEDRVTYYEFDVVAWVSETVDELILEQGMLYINYNSTIFGEYAADNGRVQIQRQGPVENFYDIVNLVENQPNRFAITYSSTFKTRNYIDQYYNDSFITNNPSAAVPIMHVKMEVLSIPGYTDISFEYDLSNGQQFYFDLSQPDEADILAFEGLVTSSTISDDYIFYDGNGDPALPVTLESFIANYKQGAVELEWSTASETQNAGFVLKRALVNEGETLEYEVITSYLDNDDLTGAGTTTERHVYTYSDRAVRPGAAYSYILEDVDYSGNVLQHDPVSVLVPENVLAANADFRLQPAYPNPFNPAFTLPFSLNRTMDVRITMYDLSGRQVRSIVNSRLDAGTYSMHVDASDLNSGIYLVRSIIGDQVNTQKMLLVK